MNYIAKKNSYLKHFLLSCVLVFTLVYQLTAQVSVSIIIAPNPPPGRPSEWITDPHPIKLLLFNLGSQIDGIVTVKLTNKSTGVEILKTALSDGKTISIPKGSSLKNAADLLQNSAFTKINRGGIDLSNGASLKAANYELCMELLDPISGNLISGPSCNQFVISDKQPPVLTVPNNSESIEELQAIGKIFQWLPVTPLSTPNSINYKFEIFEMQANQNKFQALANFPIETQINTTTQFIWINARQKILQTKSLEPNTTSKYVWRVQSLDILTDQPVGSNGGYSEIREFIVKTNTVNPVAVTTTTPTTTTPDWSPRKRGSPSTVPIVPVTSIVAVIPLQQLVEYTEPVLKALNSPLNSNDAFKEIQFKWNQVTPTFADGVVKYTLYVYKKTNKDQNDVAALATIPILQQTLNGEFSYTWKPNVYYKDDEYFIWRVKSTTDNDVLIGKKSGGEKGFSNIGTFIVKARPAKEAEPKTPTDKEVLSFKAFEKGYTFKWDKGNKAGPNTTDTILKYVIEITEKKGNKDTLIKSAEVNKNEFKWDFTPKVNGNYTWIIKTQDVNKTLIGSKAGNLKGYSATNSFSIKTEASEDSIVFKDCDGKTTVQKYTVVNTTGNIDFVDKYVKVKNFNMLVTEISSSTNSSGTYTLTGKGSIMVPWLLTPIHVEYTGIKVNGGNKTLTDGKIYAIRDGDIGDIPTFLKENNVSKITKAQAKKLGENLVKNSSKKMISGQNLNDNLTKSKGNDIPKLPLGMNNENGYTLAITEMSFSTASHKLVCVAILPYSKDDKDEEIAFAATDIEFDESSPSKAGGKLVLLEDFNIVDPADESYGITLLAKGDKGKDGQDFLTYIEWGCKGFLKLKVAVDVSLPRKWLIPTSENAIPDSTAKVKARATADIVNLNDWLLTLRLSSCEIVGLEGSELLLDTIVFDNSDSKNPPGIAFPRGFTGAKDNKFRGFYVHSAKMVLPKFFNKAKDTTGIEIAVEKLIISKTGLSGTIAVGSKENPLINLATGTLGDFQASLEKVEINILNKAITKAEVSGRLLLPISQIGTGNANTLAYSARWIEGTKKKGSSVLLEIKPVDGENLSAELLGGASLILKNSSIIKLEYTKGKNKKAKGTVVSNVILNGIIAVEKKVMGIDLNLGMEFENLGFKFDNSNPKVKNFTFNKASFGFASPQKKVGGFNATLSKVEITDNPVPANGYLASAVLSFDVNLNLGGNFSGTTSLSLTGGIKKDANNQYSPGFISASLNSIKVEATVAAVGIKGELTFYKDDAVYGQGFKGVAEANFEKVGKISASILFGSVVSPTTNKTFNYWFAEAKLVLRKPIPIVNPIGLKGAGIGAWYQMSATNGKDSVNLAAASKDEEVRGTTSGMEFKPNDKNLFGFRISGVFVTTSSERGFNGDLVFSASFTPSDGIEELSVTGAGFVGATLKDRDKALVKGTLNASYNFTTDYLNIKVAVNIMYPPQIPGSPIPGGTMLKTVGDAEFILIVDGKRKIGGEPAWALTIGTPTKPNNILYQKLFNLWFYMRMGNDLDPTGFNPTTVAELLKVSPSLTVEPVSADAKSGKGFDFGFGFHQAGNIKVGPFTGDFTVGGEMNLSLLKYAADNGCITDKMDYWYARGGAAAYANATVKFLSLKFAFAAGAIMQGGAPDPLWVKGRVAGRISVSLVIFKISYNTNVGFTYGTPCRPKKMMTASNDSNQLVSIENLDEFDKEELIQILDFYDNERTGQTDKLTPVRCASIFDINFAIENKDSHKTFTIDVIKDSVKVTKTFKVLVEWQIKACSTQPLSWGWKQTSFHFKKKKSGNEIWWEVGSSLLDGEARNKFGNSECYQTQFEATLYEKIGNNWVVAKTSKGVEITKRTKEVAFTTHSK
ncbi:MAG: hypothetical protein WCI53_11500 [Bacteroidota bacterium]